MASVNTSVGSASVRFAQGSGANRSATIMMPIAVIHEPATRNAIGTHGQRSAPLSQSANKKGVTKKRFARRALPAATPRAAPQSLAPGADEIPSRTPATDATDTATTIGTGILSAMRIPSVTATASNTRLRERSEKTVGGTAKPTAIVTMKMGHICRKESLRCWPRNKPAAINAMVCSANSQGSKKPASNPSVALMAN